MARLLLLLLLLPGLALADQPEYGPDGLPLASIARLLPGNGDLFGHRRWLAERGVTYNLWYRTDLLANLAGGRRRGVINQGLLEPAVAADLERLAGLRGLRFFANGFIIHNSGRIRRDLVGGVNTIAAIEGVPTARLSELWLEQSLFDGRAALRLGQLAADVEFFFADIQALFLQSDWPTISALNLPSGGPAFPLATPGALLRIEPTPQYRFQLAVLNGNPAGKGAGDEQLRNRHGVNFRLQDPALILAETRIAWQREDADTGLAGAVRLGGWAHLGRFDHLRLTQNGGLLADPGAGGLARRLRGAWGLYAVAEQQLYRPAGGDAGSGLTAFGRIAAAPADRSLIGLFFDAGLVASGMVPGRPADDLGASLMFARFSRAARDFDADALRLGVATAPPRGFEMNLELTWRAELRPGLWLQPVFTHVWNPGGVPGRRAVVAGLRTAIRF